MGWQPGLSAAETLCTTMDLLSGNISGAALHIIREIISVIFTITKRYFLFFTNTHIHRHIHIFINAGTKRLQTKHHLIPDGVWVEGNSITGT